MTEKKQIQKFGLRLTQAEKKLILGYIAESSR